MLVLNLITQQWKKNIRGEGFYKSLVVDALLVLLAICIAVVFLFVGYSLEDLLTKLSAQYTPMQQFNGAMIYSVFFGITFRFFMQHLSTINLTPYLILPIKRSFVIHFILIKPVFNPLNYFLFFLVMPFTYNYVLPTFGMAVSVRFVLSLVFLTWFNSFFTSFLKRIFTVGFFSILILSAFLVSIIYLEYIHYYSFFHLSVKLFSFLIFKPFALLLQFGLVCIAFGLNKLFFARNYYPERFKERKVDNRMLFADLGFLNRFGVVGAIMSVNIRMLFRHKRTLSVMYISAFFLLYGIAFYSNDLFKDSVGLLYLVAMCNTGMLMFMFGQWFLSWDGSHFDNLMTQNISIRSYINANYMLIFLFNIVCFVITSPYFFFGIKIFYLHMSAFVFNIGVNAYLILYISTFKTRPIKLLNTSASNYQGSSYKHLKIILPILLLPVGIVYLISTFANMWISLWVLTFIGLVGIMLREQIITLCVNQFNKRKFVIASGFREGE